MEKLHTDNLPLTVREHLMRGQHDAAVALLVAEYGQSDDSAKKLIEDYRQALRERKIALDIKIMNEQQDKDTRELQQFWIRWGVRLSLLALSLVFLYFALQTLH